MFRKYAPIFRCFSRRVYGKPLVYFDNGATAQKPYAVIDKVDYRTAR